MITKTESGCICRSLMKDERIENIIHPQVLKATLDGSLVTKAWCVLRLLMEGRPPDMESSCKYIE
jgi:hypothetical protein